MGALMQLTKRIMSLLRKAWHLGATQQLNGPGRSLGLQSGSLLGSLQ